jgi:hypothetical protein
VVRYDSSWFGESSAYIHFFTVPKILIDMRIS